METVLDGGRGGQGKAKGHEAGGGQRASELPFELRPEGREGTILLVKMSILTEEMTSVKALEWAAT